MKIIDLFSGIGGFALGFQKAGYQFTEHYFSEIDKHAIANYKHNFPHAKYIGDITTLHGGDFTDIDIITFGSPCQDFSLAGKREGLKGAKSSLIQHAIVLIAQLRPSVFVWENVKGAFSSNAGADFWAIIKAFANIGGYTIEWQLLNTSWLLPQNRERIYLIGHIAGRSIPGVFPIGEIAKDSSKKTRNIYDYSRTILRGYKNSTSTGSFIRTKNNKIRYLTEIECERLQGFPDNWTQYGDYNGAIKPIAKTQRYKLIGNAVTVDIVELIAKRLKKHTKMNKTIQELVPLIQEWAKERGIFKKSTPFDQLLKTHEEVGELIKACYDNDKSAIQDAIGDTMICLINYCYFKNMDFIFHYKKVYPMEAPNNITQTTFAISANNILSELFEAEYEQDELYLYSYLIEHILNGLQCIALSEDTTLEACLNIAYNEIKNRTGKMINGKFVKDEK